MYDPFCGGGTLLTVMGFWLPLRSPSWPGRISTPTLFGRRSKTLALLSREGLLRRRQRLEALFSAYGKPSHRDAVESAERLAARLPAVPLPTRVFQADACAPSLPAGPGAAGGYRRHRHPLRSADALAGEADDPLPAFSGADPGRHGPCKRSWRSARPPQALPLSRMAAAPEAEDREAAVRPVSGGLADTPCNPRPFVLY